MGVKPQVNCIVKHTFLEFSAATEKKVGCSPVLRALADTDLLASAGLIVRTTAPSCVCSPKAAPEKKLSLCLEILETPMLDAMYEPSLEAFQWMMLPEAATEVPDDMASCQWAFVPCDEYMEYCTTMQQCWGEWPAELSESTETGSTSGDSEGQSSAAWQTTLMLRNLPRNMTRDMLLQMLEEKGFGWQYDLVYLPVDFSTGVGLGYAFVNSASPAFVQKLWEAFDGLSDWPVASDKVCTVSWSDPHQGLFSHIQRYRNSPVMHATVPDEWKPALLMQGMRVEFPPPTTKIKAPKVRGKKGTKDGDEQNDLDE